MAFPLVDPLVLVGCGVLALFGLAWMVEFVMVMRRLLDMLEAINNAIERCAVELRKRK